MTRLDGDVADRHAALGRRLELVDASKERAFSRSTRTNDGYNLARAHLEAHILKYTMWSERLSDVLNA
jgi:hypothetical protein